MPFLTDGCALYHGQKYTCALTNFAESASAQYHKMYTLGTTQCHTLNLITTPYFSYHVCILNIPGHHYNSEKEPCALLQPDTFTENAVIHQE